jgi:hypothetical protein
MDKFTKLSEFKKKNGHLHCVNEESLYQFGNYQRTLRRNGKLAQNRIDLLDSIGFVWEPGKASIERWEKNFEKLKQYKQKFGDCNVPWNYKDIKLATWMGYLRSSKQIMSEDRIKRLDELGFCWKLR